MQITLSINGTQVSGDVAPRMLLIDYIRDVARLTGSHVGCTFEGVCGCCTVQLDGEAVKSCMMLAVQAQGREVRTVEGLAQAGELSPLQQAFNGHHALQCGFCTPGILMNADEMIRGRPDITRAEIRHGLVGNLCRCTGYDHIINAIEEAARLQPAMEILSERAPA